MKSWICALSKRAWAPVMACAVAALGAASLSAQEFRARQGSTVTLGARVQAQFEASGSDDTPSSFFIRRAWVTIDGRLNDWVSARAQYDINGDKVLEAYLALNASDNLQFQLGQFKRAISTFWLAANFDLPLIERDGHVPDVPACPGLTRLCSFGALTGGLGLDGYEPGILLNGRFSERASLRLTVTNGEGINGKDRNSAKSTSARLTFNVGSNSRFHAYGVMDETVGHEDTKWVPAYGLEYELGGLARWTPPVDQWNTGAQLEGRGELAGPPRQREFHRVPGDGPVVQAALGGRFRGHRAAASRELGQHPDRG